MAGKAPAIGLPLEWEKPLGDAALAQLRLQTRFTTDRQVLEPLNRLAAPLFAALTNSADRFTLWVTESREVNAFALPGGHLVFHRGLLESTGGAGLPRIPVLRGGIPRPAGRPERETRAAMKAKTIKPDLSEHEN